MIDHETLGAGTRLGHGRYEIIHRLGRGGVAIVYLARHTERSVRVALKILSEDRAQNVEDLLRFENEVKIAASLPAHVNIVRPFEMGRFSELGGRPYISMEYAPGPTLGDLVLAKPLPPRRACRLVLDVAEALDFLHRRGIIHRDVKPSNVIVSNEGGVQRAKLLDFGYAFEQSSLVCSPEERLTQIDERPGTKHYMAPEQARGGEPPAPSFDVYALAVTLYELLVGHPPYHAHPPHEVVLRKIDPTLPSLSIDDERPDLLPPLRALVDRGLEREPKRRIASAAEFRDELRRVVELLDYPSKCGDGVARLERLPRGDTATPTCRPQPQRSRSLERRPKTWARWLTLGVALTIMLVTVGVIGARMTLDGMPGGAATMADGAVGAVGSVGDRAVISSHAQDSATARPARAAPFALAHPDDTGHDNARAKSDAGPERAELTVFVPPKAPRAKKTELSPNSGPSTEPAEPAGTPSRIPCTQVRKDTEMARLARSWSKVARLTKRRGCWVDDDVRMRTRVLALHRLGQYERCAAMRDLSSDPEVQRTATICQRSLAKEHSP